MFFLNHIRHICSYMSYYGLRKQKQQSSVKSPNMSPKMRYPQNLSSKPLLFASFLRYL